MRKKVVGTAAPLVVEVAYCPTCGGVIGTGAVGFQPSWWCPVCRAFVREPRYERHMGEMAQKERRSGGGWTEQVVGG